MAVKLWSIVAHPITFTILWLIVAGAFYLMFVKAFCPAICNYKLPDAQDSEMGIDEFDLMTMNVNDTRTTKPSFMRGNLKRPVRREAPIPEEVARPVVKRKPKTEKSVAPPEMKKTNPPFEDPEVCAKVVGRMMSLAESFLPPTQVNCEDIKRVACTRSKSYADSMIKESVREVFLKIDHAISTYDGIPDPIKQFYSSCQTWTKQGSEYGLDLKTVLLVNILQKIGEWPVRENLPDQTSEKVGWIDYVVTLKRKWPDWMWKNQNDVPGLWKVYDVQSYDVEGNLRNIVVLDWSAEEVLLPSLKSDGEQPLVNEEMLKLYKDYIMNTLESIHPLWKAATVNHSAPEDAFSTARNIQEFLRLEETAEKIVQFEQKLLHVYWRAKRVQKELAEKDIDSYSAISLEKLQNLYGSDIDWDSITRELRKHDQDPFVIKRMVNLKNSVLVRDQYIAELVSLLRDTELETIKNYLQWRLIERNLYHFGGQFSFIKLAFRKEACRVTGVSYCSDIEGFELPDRSEMRFFCPEMMIARFRDYILPLISNPLNESTKQNWMDMINGLRIELANFVVDVNDTRITRQMKTQLLQRLLQMTIQLEAQTSIVPILGLGGKKRLVDIQDLNFIDHLMGRIPTESNDDESNELDFHYPKNSKAHVDSLIQYEESSNTLILSLNLINSPVMQAMRGWDTPEMTSFACGVLGPIVGRHLALIAQQVVFGLPWNHFLKVSAKSRSRTNSEILGIQTAYNYLRRIRRDADDYEDNTSPFTAPIFKAEYLILPKIHDNFDKGRRVDVFQEPKELPETPLSWSFGESDTRSLLTPKQWFLIGYVHSGCWDSSMAGGHQDVAFVEEFADSFNCLDGGKASMI